MTLHFFYFDVEHAMKVHDWIIEYSGGRAGNNNLDLLGSPLKMIQHDLYYPAIEDKLTHLVYLSIKITLLMMETNDQA